MATSRERPPNEDMSLTTGTGSSTTTHATSLDHTTTPNSVSPSDALIMDEVENGVENGDDVEGEDVDDDDDDMSGAGSDWSSSYASRESTELDGYTFDRNECIAAVRDFYQFLVQMYAEEDSIQEPPHGGWPSITLETVTAMGKSGVVYDLLRHLPYMQSRVWFHFQFSTFSWKDLVTYKHHDPAGLISMTEDHFDDSEERAPHDVIGFAGRGRDVGAMLFDTTYGVAYWTDCGNEYSKGPIRPIQDNPFTRDSPQGWRDTGGPWTFANFFELLKNDLRELRIVPIDSSEVMGNHEGDAELEAEVFRSHGWPDLQLYRKADCMRALAIARKKREEDEEGVSD